MISFALIPAVWAGVYHLSDLTTTVVLTALYASFVAYTHIPAAKLRLHRTLRRIRAFVRGDESYDENEEEYEWEEEEGKVVYSWPSDFNWAAYASHGPTTPSRTDTSDTAPFFAPDDVSTLRVELAALVAEEAEHDRVVQDRINHAKTVLAERLLLLSEYTARRQARRLAGRVHGESNALLPPPASSASSSSAVAPATTAPESPSLVPVPLLPLPFPAVPASATPSRVGVGATSPAMSASGTLAGRFRGATPGSPAIGLGFSPSLVPASAAAAAIRAGAAAAAAAAAAGAGGQGGRHSFFTQGHHHQHHQHHQLSLLPPPLASALPPPHPHAHAHAHAHAHVLVSSRASAGLGAGTAGAGTRAGAGVEEVNGRRAILAPVHQPLLPPPVASHLPSAALAPLAEVAALDREEVSKQNGDGYYLFTGPAHTHSATATAATSAAAAAASGVSVSASGSDYDARSDAGSDAEEEAGGGCAFEWISEGMWGPVPDPDEPFYLPPSPTAMATADASDMPNAHDPEAATTTAAAGRDRMPSYTSTRTHSFSEAESDGMPLSGGALSGVLSGALSGPSGFSSLHTGIADPWIGTLAHGPLVESPSEPASETADPRTTLTAATTDNVDDDTNAAPPGPTSAAAASSAFGLGGGARDEMDLVALPPQALAPVAVAVASASGTKGAKGGHSGNDACAAAAVSGSAEFEPGSSETGTSETPQSPLELLPRSRANTPQHRARTTAIVAGIF